jgi:signal transduction histidine kinase
VGRLAGGLAHDFNNFLSAINGYCQMMLNTLDRSDPTRAWLDEIKKAGDQAASLMRELLIFSRQPVLVPQILDLNEVVAGVENMLRHLIGKGVELVTLPGPALWQVKTDPARIKQVIVNLAVNARDAMPEGGRLTIETSNVELDGASRQRRPAVTPGQYVVLAVSDTGIGMDAETQAHVFEPFFTTKEEGKGTGLGLAMVYGTVKQSGGAVWVDSEPGQGAMFTIYLPRVEELPATSDGVDAPRPDLRRAQLPPCRP